MKVKTTDPRRLRTHDALVTAGIALFCERDPDAVTVDEIVARAGVGKGSFYNHFADRTGLVDAIFTRVREQVEALVSATNQGVEDPAIRMARANCCYYRFAVSNPQMASFANRSTGAAASTLDAGLRHDLALGIAQGRFDVPHPDAALALVQGVVREGVMRIINGIAADEIPDFVTAAAAMVLRALGTEPSECEPLAREAAMQVVTPVLAPALADGAGA